MRSKFFIFVAIALIVVLGAICVMQNSVLQSYPKQLTYQMNDGTTQMICFRQWYENDEQFRERVGWIYQSNLNKLITSAYDEGPGYARFVYR